MSPLGNRPRATVGATRIGIAVVIGVVIMIGMLFSQGLGFIFSTNLAPLQASAAIAGFGTPVIAAWALKQHGWRGMRYMQFDGAQRRAVLRIALGSFFVNIFAPLATALLGAGPAATATTVGSLMVGLTMLRGIPPLLLRVLVVIGVILSTDALNGHLNVVGVVAASLAAWHFWNLPGCLKTLGAGSAKPGDDHSDQGMVWANIIATPVVIGVAVALSMFQGRVPILADIKGSTWMFGPEQWATMIGMAFLVMVIPVFLTNAAARRLSKDNVGAMQSMSAPIYALVGVIATVVGIVNNPFPNTHQWVGFIVVTLAAASAVLVAAHNAVSRKDLADMNKAKDEFESYATGLSPEVLAELRFVGCTAPAELIEVGHSDADVRLVVHLMEVGATSTEALTFLATSPSAEKVSRYLLLRSVTRTSDGVRLSHSEALDALVELSNVTGREARVLIGNLLLELQESKSSEPVPAMRALTSA